MKKLIVRQALRYFVAAQAGPVVILQGAWILLAMATWSDGDAADSGVAETMRTLVRGFVWLGGTDEDGRGNGSTLFVVWGKLSLVVYLIDAAVRKLRGNTQAQLRRSVWWWAGLSALVTFFGMGVALWPTPDSLLGLTPLLVLSSVLSAGTAAWAVAIRRLVERSSEKQSGED